MAEEKKTEQVKGRYEMLWDCSYCSAARLLALTHRHCPECGAAQDQTKRYFPKDDEKVAVKDDYAGSDKKCGSCGHPNGSKATFCASCGAPLDEAAAAVAKRSDRRVKAGEQFAHDDSKKAAAELGGGAKPKVAAVKKKSWVWLYILIFAAAVIFSIWFFCIRAKSVEFQVAERRWIKTSPVEKWKEVGEKKWKSDLPNNAEIISCTDEPSSESRSVDDGKECHMVQKDKGDGTFEEVEECSSKTKSEAVKKPKCRYKYWVEDEDATRSNVRDDGEEPDWPDFSISSDTSYERRGERREVFEVDLIRDGDTTTCKVKEEVWKELYKGTAAKGLVRGKQESVDCSSIEPM